MGLELYEEAARVIGETTEQLKKCVVFPPSFSFSLRLSILRSGTAPTFHWIWQSIMAYVWHTRASWSWLRYANIFSSLWCWYPYVFFPSLSPHKTKSNLQPNFEKLMEHGVDSYGDLYCDVAETYAVTNQHEKAANMYKILVGNPAYNYPSVHMRLAECYLGYNNFTDAIEAFNTSKWEGRGGKEVLSV